MRRVLVLYALITQFIITVIAFAIGGHLLGAYLQPDTNLNIELAAAGIGIAFIMNIFLFYAFYRAGVKAKAQQEKQASTLAKNEEFEHKFDDALFSTTDILLHTFNKEGQLDTNFLESDKEFVEESNEIKDEKTS